MAIENKNGLPPMDMTEADQTYLSAIGDVISATSRENLAGDHFAQVRQHNGSLAEIAQADNDYVAADMARQREEQRLRRLTRQSNSVRTILAKLFG